MQICLIEGRKTPTPLSLSLSLFRGGGDERPLRPLWIRHCLVLLKIGMSEWLLFLTPTQQFFIISWREEVNFQWDDDEVRFVLGQHAELDLHGTSSLKQQSADRHVAPLGHIIQILSHPVFALSP